jgi:integrase
MKRALKAAGNVPIDGPIEEIQDYLDETLEDDLDKHNTVCGRINRIRKWLKLPLLVPARKERKDVAYLTKAEVEKLIAKLPEPHKTLAAVAFYTGLRRGEIFALEPSSLKRDTIDVHAQLHLVSGDMRLPKNGKKRKAFIIPGGEIWVKKWLKMKTATRLNPKTEEEENLYKPNLGLSQMIRKHSGGKRFHDLRHSYAVYLISKGLSLDWVAQSLGNSRDVCERHYATHILQQDSIDLMRAALKKVQ